MAADRQFDGRALLPCSLCSRDPADGTAQDSTRCQGSQEHQDATSHASCHAAQHADGPGMHPSWDPMASMRSSLTAIHQMQLAAEAIHTGKEARAAPSDPAADVLATTAQPQWPGAHQDVTMAARQARKSSVGPSARPTTELDELELLLQAAVEGYAEPLREMSSYGGMAGFVPPLPGAMDGLTPAGASPAVPPLVPMAISSNPGDLLDDSLLRDLLLPSLGGVSIAGAVSAQMQAAIFSTGGGTGETGSNARAGAAAAQLGNATAGAAASTAGPTAGMRPSTSRPCASHPPQPSPPPFLHAVPSCPPTFLPHHPLPGEPMSSQAIAYSQQRYAHHAAGTHVPAAAAPPHNFSRHTEPHQLHQHPFYPSALHPAHPHVFPTEGPAPAQESLGAWCSSGGGVLHNALSSNHPLALSHAPVAPPLPPSVSLPLLQPSASVPLPPTVSLPLPPSSPSPLLPSASLPLPLGHHEGPSAPGRAEVARAVVRMQAHAHRLRALAELHAEVAAKQQQPPQQAQDRQLQEEQQGRSQPHQQLRQATGAPTHHVPPAGEQMHMQAHAQEGQLGSEGATNIQSMSQCQSADTPTSQLPADSSSGFTECQAPTPVSGPTNPDVRQQAQTLQHQVHVVYGSQQQATGRPAVAVASQRALQSQQSVGIKGQGDVAFGTSSPMAAAAFPSTAKVPAAAAGCTSYGRPAVNGTGAASAEAGSMRGAGGPTGGSTLSPENLQALLQRAMLPQAKLDPLDDPNTDPATAKRIARNRMHAQRSKARQRELVESLRAKLADAEAALTAPVAAGDPGTASARMSADPQPSTGAGVAQAQQQQHTSMHQQQLHKAQERGFRHATAAAGGLPSRASSARMTAGMAPMAGGGITGWTGPGSCMLTTAGGSTDMAQQQQVSQPMLLHELSELQQKVVHLAAHNAQLITYSQALAAALQRTEAERDAALQAAAGGSTAPCSEAVATAPGPAATAAATAAPLPEGCAPHAGKPQGATTGPIQHAGSGDVASPLACVSTSDSRLDPAVPMADQAHAVTFQGTSPGPGAAVAADGQAATQQFLPVTVTAGAISADPITPATARALPASTHPPPPTVVHAYAGSMHTTGQFGHPAAYPMGLPAGTRRFITVPAGTPPPPPPPGMVLVRVSGPGGMLPYRPQNVSSYHTQQRPHLLPHQHHTATEHLGHAHLSVRTSVHPDAAANTAAAGPGSSPHTPHTPSKDAAAAVPGHEAAPASGVDDPATAATAADTNGAAAPGNNFGAAASWAPHGKQGPQGSARPITSPRKRSAAHLHDCATSSPVATRAEGAPLVPSTPPKAMSAPALPTGAAAAAAAAAAGAAVAASFQPQGVCLLSEQQQQQQQLPSAGAGQQAARGGIDPDEDADDDMVVAAAAAAAALLEACEGSGATDASQNPGPADTRIGYGARQQGHLAAAATAQTLPVYQSTTPPGQLPVSRDPGDFGPFPTQSPTKRQAVDRGAAAGAASMPSYYTPQGHTLDPPHMYTTSAAAPGCPSFHPHYTTSSAAVHVAPPPTFGGVFSASNSLPAPAAGPAPDAPFSTHLPYPHSYGFYDQQPHAWFPPPPPSQDHTAYFPPPSYYPPPPSYPGVHSASLHGPYPAALPGAARHAAHGRLLHGSMSAVAVGAPMPQLQHYEGHMRSSGGGALIS